MYNKILVVDDKPLNIEILIFSLKKYGFEVDVVTSAALVLNYLQEHTPDLILLDILMPEISGYELCKEIKQHTHLYDIPIIFISALSDTIDKVRAFNVGAVDYLTKPLDFEEVIARVRNHITLYRQNKEIKQLLIERERAENAERQERMMVNALLNIAGAINSTLELHEVIRRILEGTLKVVPHHGVILTLLASHFSDVTTSFCDFDSVYCELPGWMPQYLNEGVLELPEQYLTASDLMIELTDHQSVYNCLSIPIWIEKKVGGVLTLLNSEGVSYTSEHVERLRAIASHASVAIQNAHLYEQAQSVAIVEERQRLARELHDSVTQTLYAASKIAEALPLLLDKKPERVKDYLHELSELTRVATVEMRALLMELRPESLTQKPLFDLLSQLCAVLKGRTGICVKLTGDYKDVLPPHLQLVYYRIAQEALNNIIKHANASSVSVNLCYNAPFLELRVTDNGQGFELKKTWGDQMGMKIMRERAATIQAEFELKSIPQTGTEIILRGKIE